MHDSRSVSTDIQRCPSVDRSARHLFRWHSWFTQRRSINTKENPISEAFPPNLANGTQRRHLPPSQAPQYPNNFTVAIAPHPAARTCDSCVAAIISEIASL
jgi:hypothetical protein